MSESQPVTIVTGAGRGICFGIAEVLVAAGHRVAVWDVAGAEDAAARLGADHVGHTVDVTDPDDVARAAATVLDRFGQVDGLVNGAIQVRRGRLEDIAGEDWHATLATGLTASFHCAQAVGRSMLARGRGSIVNIASVSGIMPQPLLGSYSAAKAGVIALTQQIAVEWGPRGVRCNAISPGMVWTATSDAIYSNPDLLAQRRRLIPLDRLAAPADMGDAVEFLLSDRAAYVNGVNLVVDGGLSLGLIDNMPSVGPDGGILPGSISRTSAITVGRFRHDADG